ncbi:unnamed protein product [Phytophthora fragariaefolia]|uniref:Unnamed protein product n=1 Tax=Phytophthora fragariaefolia TaxID=1490495 RepID=A0A9W6X2F9_9STRA|nr:unnamed protein product [Phytophthora fragariaefolia]
MPSQRGNHRTFDPKALEPVIRSYIDAQNRLLQPVTAQKIANEVKNKCNVSLELRTMQRLLQELDFHYIVGKKRHISADTPANVDFRNAYLTKKLSNRRPEKNGRFDPRKTEVFLDESFCNVNHVSNKTWVLEDRIRYNKSGRGARLSATKAQLMEYVKPLKEKPIYKAQVTASLDGHYLLYTPPYHPELQPIELVWATVKGRIAASPPKNANDAVQKVLEGLAAIKGKEFLSVYRHAQTFENDYAAYASESSESKLMAAEDKI